MKSEESRIKVEEARQLKEIDRQHEYEDAQNRIRVDSAAALADRQLEKSLETDLREAREERHQTEIGDKPLILKQQLLADCDAKIARIQRRIDGLQHDRQADSQEQAG